jgi:hypothetical protein
MDTCSPCLAAGAGVAARIKSRFPILVLAIAGIASALTVLPSRAATGRAGDSHRSGDARSAGGPSFRAIAAAHSAVTHARHAESAPAIVSLSPDRQYPKDMIEIRGHGFDIVDVANNVVRFEDTLRRPAGRQGVVKSVSIEGSTGLEVLTVEVPRLAGNGPVTVRTALGQSKPSARFYVMPLVLELRQPASIPGAKIRVFGYGFDLATAAKTNSVSFASAQAPPSEKILARVLASAIDRSTQREILTVRVPVNVADIGPIHVHARTYAEGSDSVRPFTRLRPVMCIRRADLVAEHVVPGQKHGYGRCGHELKPIERKYDLSLSDLQSQGCTGSPISVTLHDFPYDPYFHYGRTAHVVLKFRGGEQFAFGDIPLSPRRGKLVADALHILRTVPQLSKGNRGGTLEFTAVDVNLRPASANAIFRVPRRDVPIIFVPGTSGTSLDLLPPALTLAFPGDGHPPIQGELPLFHPPWLFNYNPGALDDRGPRIWMGPEMILNTVFAPSFGVTQHYLDILGFDESGRPLYPVAPGTVMEDMTVPLAGHFPIYNYLLNALRLGFPGRVYLFPHDWRLGLPELAGQLNQFVDKVIATTGADRVTLVTHSYGGPIARWFYLGDYPSSAKKVDQVISVGGGYLGVLEPLRILEVGDDWGLGWKIPGNPSIGAGLGLWELRNLSRNWPTAYAQLPNSQEWFADDGKQMGTMRIDRSYIRPPDGAGLRSWFESEQYIAARYNRRLADEATHDFLLSGYSTNRLGNFMGGTGSVLHHRIIGEGRMNTAQGIQINRVDNIFPLPPFFISTPIFGDGDSTIPYHGALGLTDRADQRVYIVTPGTPPDRNKHLEMTQQPFVINLISEIIRGDVCSQRAVSSQFKNQNDVVEQLSSGGTGTPVSPQQISSTAGHR